MKPETVEAPTPWHPGEQAMQARMGVVERMALIGPRVLRDYMPDQHRELFAELPFIVLGAVDAAGAPWATLVAGAPGFVSSPDARTLRLAATLSGADPAARGVAAGSAVGFLGIQPHTRRRNRANGRVTAVEEGGITVHVEQSFGNCPKYIHRRQAHYAARPTPSPPAERLAGLDPAAREAIAAADTFFVASHADVADTRTVDVSHRGGPAGFVAVDGDVLTVPDYTGNRFFNTLGNILVSGRAGLVFIDSVRGDVLQLTGRAEIVHDGPLVAAVEGAQRVWRVHTEQAVRRTAALDLRFVDVPVPGA